MSNRVYTGSFPSRQQLEDYVKDHAGAVDKRDIARAFNIRGNDKIMLKAMLREMEEDGTLQRSVGKAYSHGSGLPPVTVVKVVDANADGDVFAEPENWQQQGRPPRILISARRFGQDGRSARGRRSAVAAGRAPALGVGDRVLARIEKQGDRYRGQVVKILESRPEEIVGVVRRHGEEWVLEPTNKRLRATFSIAEDALGGAQAGDLVKAEPISRKTRYGLQHVRVEARLGDPYAPRSLSLIAISEKDIPHIFSREVLDEAEAAARLSLEPTMREADGYRSRVDLRHIPFLPIDPADARDHDDAIWAQPAEAGGWAAAVAIADVSFYVRPGSGLDREARKRGNSVYFPDRVVPMLPEVLSAGVCSLKDDADRASLVCHLEIGADGELKSWRFERALVRMAANVAYEEAQRQITAGKGSLHHLLEPLWGAWAALSRARDAREPLELDLPEKRIVLDVDGNIKAVEVRERLDAHRVVEDFMIAANVAAAKELERLAQTVVYRVHETPSREKLVALKDFLATLGVPLALGQVIRPSLFNRITAQVEGEDIAEQVSQQVLRTQTQAVYSTRNAGHFGLSLGSYAHFTSPIRRYSDLLVHRALVLALRLGEGGLRPSDVSALEETAEHISNTERRAMEAERDTTDRYVAAYLAERAGQIVQARVTGVTRFGLFMTIVDIGGDGLIPISTLGDERFTFEQASQTLVGDRSGTTYHLGQKLAVRLVEASTATGALRLELIRDADDGDKPANRPRRPAGAQRRPTGGFRTPDKAAGRKKRGR